MCRAARERQADNRSRPGVGFAAATAALIAVFAASGSPIPLYERYRAAAGLTTADLSVAAVTCFVEVMLALVVLSRLSDHLGRRTIRAWLARHGHVVDLTANRVDALLTAARSGRSGARIELGNGRCVRIERGMMRSTASK